VLEVVRWTTARFEKQGLASPRLDAELLATRAFAISRVELYTHFDRPLGEEELAAYRELVRRRLAGNPVAYLLGQKEFWSLDLRVDPRVLVPRPDTETLVELALDRLAAWPPDHPVRVADIGTGSGAIALALKKERPGAEVWAVDVSADALAVARDNAARLALDVHFVGGHLLDPLEGPFALIVSNPPYIPSGDIDGLAPEVRHEPRLALDGGADGLDVVRELIGQAARQLAPGGTLAVEIGADQAGATRDLFTRAGFAEVGHREDLAGIARVVHGLKGNPA
jgi:release factor glutamine methyltransferase